MTRSAKSRYALNLIGAAAAALVVGALLAPSIASAAPAENEYDLELPGGDGKGVDPSAGSSGGGGSDAGESPGTAVPGDAGSTESETDEGAAAGGRDSGGKGGSAGPSGAGENGDPGTATEAGALKAQGSTSGGDGVPLILILIAAVGLACLLGALWRLRSSGVADPAQATGRSA